MPLPLLIATTNPGKAREFAQLLRSLPYKIISLSDLSAPPIPEPEETGQSFLENASLKAAYYARATRHHTLADDSGLCVDALNGDPGVHSAYFAFRSTPFSDLPDRTVRDPANNTRLLKLLKGTPDPQRTARFVCSLALADPDGHILLTSRGTFEGSIRHVPAGDHGFGYDPLFQPAGMTVSSAQLPSEEKNRLSHRAQATAQLVAQLQRFPLT